MTSTAPPGLLLAVWLLVLLGCARGAESAAGAEGAAGAGGAAGTGGAAGASHTLAEPPPDLRTRTTGSDWPGFLGPHREPRSDETGILRDWPAAGPDVVWDVAAGEGYSMPSVGRGRLFLFDRVGDRARLRALESETGEQLWSSDYPTEYEDAFGYSNGPRAAPLVDGDRVYVHGADGKLRCHRVVDGAVLWERDLEPEYGIVTNFFGAASTPLVWGDLLLVVVGGSPPGDYDVHQGRVIPNGTGMVAFDKLTGEERWRSVDELSSYSSPLLRTLHGEDRVVWLARGGLVLLEPGSGAVDLQVPFRARKVYSVNGATPIVRGGEIFLTESYELGGRLLRIARDRRSAEEVWRDPRARRDQAMATHWMTPAEQDGILYGSSGENSGDAKLNAVEWSTGRIRWSKPGLNRSTVLLVDRHLVVLTEYGKLLLVEATPEEYREKAQVELRGNVDGEDRPLIRFPAWQAPILAHGLLYLRGKDRLVALQLIPD
ncbi:MAG TPA: PQQ-binding-like beta-propeller repeat protein [Thermoanaerobaculia bacterium]|nr:PQQ-binding-like beta-propeller repeat protein [Thermoanaerobaculia bacterium]